MTDLEQQVRDVLESKSRDAYVSPRPAPKLLKRARRRQVGTVLASALTVAAVVTGSIVGLQALLGHPSARTTVGNLPEAPAGFTSVILPYASIAYPSSWYLLELSRGDPSGDLLQLTNFDPAFTSPCLSGDAVDLPNDGVLLLVDNGNGPTGTDAPRWPVELAPNTAPTACPNGEHWASTWASEDGATPFQANAVFGPDASAADRDALLQAFGSLTVISDGASQTEGLIGSADLILDSADTPLGPVALYAYLDADGAWIGVAGSAGSGISGAGGIGSEPPTGDEDVTMNLGATGGIVWGDVSTAAVRAELRTVEVRTFPATLVPLPASLDADGMQAVWGSIEGPTTELVTTLLYDAQGNVINDVFPTEPQQTIANGRYSSDTTWRLYLTHDNTGTGLVFEIAGPRSGTWGGCCLSALKDGQDLRLDGIGSGSGGVPQNVLGLASSRVTSVVYVDRSGTQIPGGLFPLPPGVAGGAQVWLVLVPADMPVNGEVVATDASGAEVGHEPAKGYTPPRVPVTNDNSEPPGPTQEIDAVWTRLRTARDGISSYPNDHGGSLTGLDLIAAAALDQSVTWNDSPSALPGEVSIRGVTADRLVLVSVTTAGETYCIGLSVDANGGTGYRYGRQDAATYEACSGGW